ncbi:MAG TPA: ATP-binding cassette domain-containing protein, partial [Xanthobacteraceae bacterium]|nr:ATP-binding cassette domain-containing protein [Xanthobacteraceae bacterium]
MSDSARAAAEVRLEHIEKSFDGSTRAVDGIDLTIEPGEFFALLGPSGCGKTTTLRMIAGFEEPDAGRILIAGDDVTHMPAYRRDLGMI